MTKITAALVKDLRSKTGAGMMDCKKALTECAGDVEAAVDWLRQNGLAVAGNKEGRTASEGLVGLAVGGNAGAIVEVNSETDFVAKNEQFQDFVGTIAGLVLANEADKDSVIASGYPGSDRTVSEQLIQNIATIGENMNIRRMDFISVKNGVIGSYMHNSAAPEMGRIGVLVALQSEAKPADLLPLAKQIAMHVAATGPRVVNVDDLDERDVEREREVLAGQARQSGKPEEIIAKMIDGRIRKYFDKVVLMRQTFVIDGERTIEKVLEEAAGELGAEVKIDSFVRFSLGEGIEKAETDFAAEVASAVGA
ncbi:MAG: translation elongation factor Ts [Sphingomonadales bacterium]